ncbi:S9 family peptidase [Synechococcus sp. RSCCF101]|nr:S9 family peptidase [Synechococcus sp. RSCCF101]
MSAPTPPPATGPDPLDSALATGRWPSIREPRLLASRLYWLEQRPGEGGRTTLMALPLASVPVGDGRRLDQLPAQEITPAPCDLRSRVHDYGGGVVALHQNGAGTTVVWVDDRDGCLWSRTLEWPVGSGPCRPGDERRLCEPAARQFADGLIDDRRQRWIGVMEAGGSDALVSVPLSGGEPELLKRGEAFLGYAALSPDGSRLCWVEWASDAMPWERSRLHLARIGRDGRLEGDCVIAGDQAAPCSLFQPLWLGSGDLVVASDRSGFWNLERLEGAQNWSPIGDSDGTSGTTWQPLMPAEEEFAMPQWAYGMRTTAWDGEQLISASCRQGRWRLGAIAAPSQWRELATPFDDLAWLDGENGSVVAVAASARTAPGLLHLRTRNGTPGSPAGRWTHLPCADLPVAAAAIREPEVLWFSGASGARTQAWYHPPATPATGPAPLLVKVHSGPTSMARPSFSPLIRFWTSRGWGVVDVNYGGSTGFGRAYRERLDGGWGVVDVADCAAAARALIDAGRAHPERIAMEGGSAGGFTTLACLAFTGLFQAGACRYPVCDPALLAQATHRFEAHYLDRLIGPWPEARSIYEARSPLHQVERITAPVILFQGLRDRVVPPEHSERMAAALRQRGVPVELHTFADEGHGFRDSRVQQQVLEATEAFFRHHLGLDG